MALDVPLVLQVGNSSDDLSGIVEEEEDWTNEADATVPPEEPTGLESFE